MDMKTLIFIVSFFLLSALPAFAETTNTGSTDLNQFLDDGTCPSGGRYASYCCYKKYRYSCRWLNRQLANGLCRASNNSTNWTNNCSDAPPTASEETPPRTEGGNTSSGGNLSYAATLTSCASYGRQQAAAYARSRGKSSGCGYCANGTRHALMCMFRKLGNPKTVHCGGAAYDYTDSCMSRHGFKRDMNACNKAGVVRVYRGGRHMQSGASGGDRYGHIEFKGTDGRYHAGCSASAPINELLGNSRRRLVGCYVLR